MRSFASFPAAGLVLLLSVAPAAADQTDPRLDGLFDALQDAPSAAQAATVEQRIWRIWGERDDARSRFLMKQGQMLLKAGALSQAVTNYSLLISHAPAFAEAWNKRATAYYLMGEHEKSLDDIGRVLALEPRHFGALSGMGLVLMSMGREEAALKSFEAALRLHPQLPGARANVEVLREKVLGEPL